MSGTFNWHHLKRKLNRPLNLPNETFTDEKFLNEKRALEIQLIKELKSKLEELQILFSANPNTIYSYDELGIKIKGGSFYDSFIRPRHASLERKQILNNSGISETHTFMIHNGNFLFVPNSQVESLNKITNQKRVDGKNQKNNQLILNAKPLILELVQINQSVCVRDIKIITRLGEAHTSKLIEILISEGYFQKYTIQCKYWYRRIK
jgi:hypothetical protein